MTKPLPLVTKITILRVQYGSDRICLHLDIPTATWPYEGTETATIHCASGYAEDYISVYFPGIPYEVIRV